MEVPEVVAKAETPKISFFRKVVSNITVEPLVICWLLPFLLTYAAIENLNIEKACRGFVDENTGFEKDICKIFVRKDAFQIECDGKKAIHEDAIKKDAIETKFPEIYSTIKDNFTGAMDFLCDTEIKAQEKLSGINSIRNPISAIGPLTSYLQNNCH